MPLPSCCPALCGTVFGDIDDGPAVAIDGVAGARMGWIGLAFERPIGAGADAKADKVAGETMRAIIGRIG
jgi:hypothetical protein